MNLTYKSVQAGKLENNDKRMHPRNGRFRIRALEFNTQKSRRDTVESGFTLIELLVSLALIGVIAVMITGAMKVSLDAVERGEQKIDEIERLRSSMHIVSSQLQSQLPLTQDVDGERTFYFQGDSQSMQFPTGYSIWTGQRGYVLVSYTIESEEDETRLLTVSERIIGTETSSETALMKALDAASFEYFYPATTEEEGSWGEEWTDTLSIPEKIRIHMIYDDRDLSMVIPTRSKGAFRALTDVRSGQKRLTPWKNIKKEAPRL